jgi:hypothetical protein
MAGTIMLTAISVRVENVVARLKSISSIKPGQYWCTYTGAAQESGKITSVLRTIYYWEEDRDLNAADITGCVDNAFRVLSDILTYCETSSEELEERRKCLSMYQTLIDDVKVNIISAKDGVSNLKVTYHKDELLKSKLTALVKSIDDKISQFYKNLAELVKEN